MSEQKTMAELLDDAWAKVQAEDAEAEDTRLAEQEESTRAYAIKRFGVAPDKVKGNVAWYGNVRLENRDATFDYTLQCPDCGQWYDAGSAWDIKQLARSIHEPRKHGSWECPGQGEESTTLQITSTSPEGRLILALREMIAGES